MSTYEYIISLRISHPSMDPAEITTVLGREPSRTWLVGQPRTTAKGAPLKGVYRESFWTSRVAEGSLNVEKLGAAIDEIVTQLEPHKAFFRKLSAEGGEAEFFIGWFLEGNSGDVLTHELFGRLADMKIDLALDIYPDRDD